MASDGWQEGLVLLLRDGGETNQSLNSFAILGYTRGWASSPVALAEVGNTDKQRGHVISTINEGSAPRHQFGGWGQGLQVKAEIPWRVRPWS